MKAAFLTLLIVSLCVSIGSAQPKTKKTPPILKKAQDEYRLLHYVAAIKQLDEVLRVDSDNVAAQEMMADSYRKIKDYDQALFWYKRLNKQKDAKPEWILYYAEALANKEQYEQSEQWYRKFMVAAPGDRRAGNFVKLGTGISGLSEDKGDWKVSYTNINTAGAEYSPMFYKKGLVFSSNRRIGKVSKDVFGWDQTPFTDLYLIDDLKRIGEVSKTDMEDIERQREGNAYKINDDDTEEASNDSKTLGQYSTRVLVDLAGERLAAEVKAVKLRKKINSRFHEGPSVLLPEGSLMFTRNNYYKGKASKSKKGGINKLKLFTATGPNWNHIQSFPYNDNEYSVGHPAVTKDGSILVFVSDMPGGYGGTDLYYSVRTSAERQWSKPVNLGARINTEGNEQFPYFDKNGKLYFSSTGYAGLGGLDIFEVTLKDMRPTGVPHNLGAPLNSSGDDFGFIKADDERSGYFSSNRGGNDDIYKFEQSSYRVALKGVVTDTRTRLPIAGAQVLLRHFGGIDTLVTNRAGAFQKDLAKETDYEIVAQKPGYVTSNNFFTTAGIDKDTTLNEPLKLGRAELGQQFVLNKCDSLKRVFAVQNIYYDLDKSYIRPDAYPALDHLVMLMREHPEIEIVTASHTDSRASDQYNKRLSLMRGNAARTYLMYRGIDGKRIRVEYYGKSRLTNRCFDGVPCSEEEQQLNRRTEFDIIVNGVNLSQLNCGNP
ncbi:OmpA family protein [Pedobacter sp. HMF7056]|uniref:OmpA family protein n=1 Tax=Hufsiella ginkgonis TaxID=2695274 RepID=A0A7K1XZC9_9SPHI|nr:OmpA family protein [Hufsiella ginkgonis]